jgi:hypothetical protein
VAIIYKTCNILYVLVSFETVANNIRAFANFSFGQQVFGNVNIECGRGFEVNIILECLVHDIAKVRTFGTVAIVIFTFVFVFFHGMSKPIFGSLDVVGNLR